MRAGVGWNPEWIGDGILRAQTGSLADYTLHSADPVLFNDLRRESRFQHSPFLEDHGVVSGMNVLLRKAGEPCAILGVYSSHPRAFKEHDIHCVQAVANILATAIERHQAEERMQTFNAELEQRVKQRTEQLELANRELEAFSYSVSHDLRAPLRHMDGFAEILRSSLPDDQVNEQVRLSLRAISEAARKMSRLIEDLLSFSRTARVEMNSVPVNLAAAVEKVCAELKSDCDGRQVAWQIQALPTVDGDPEMLRLVFTNLIANALKYTRPCENARIEIGVQPTDTEIVLYVRDNGVGFDPQYAHKLFGVFQRLHSAKEFDGTGIGLAIVRRIIMRHGGRAWAEGSLGNGATFYVALPNRILA
jgi:light-regulated signal transduction histidine kinase (bacteriophytochrome)